MPSEEPRREDPRRAAAAPPPLPFPWPDLSGVHAFLIEDNEDTRAMVTETLTHCGALVTVFEAANAARSEEHTSEPSHLVISYAVFCLKKKKKKKKKYTITKKKTINTTQI